MPRQKNKNLILAKNLAWSAGSGQRPIKSSFLYLSGLPDALLLLVCLQYKSLTEKYNPEFFLRTIMDQVDTSWIV